MKSFRKTTVCECGCFKFRMYWSSARCWHCGTWVKGKQGVDWVPAPVKIIPLRPLIQEKVI